MHLKDHPDWHDVVAKNWTKTTGYLLALHGTCIKTRDDELQGIKENRVLVGLSAGDLQAWTPPASWFLGVLLCPGDSIDALVKWAKLHRVDGTRVHFYAHPDADAGGILQAWGKAGYAMPAVDEGIGSWRNLHKKFGNDLSIRILEDWGSAH